LLREAKPARGRGSTNNCSEALKAVRGRSFDLMLPFKRKPLKIVALFITKAVVVVVVVVVVVTYSVVEISSVVVAATVVVVVVVVDRTDSFAYP